MDFIYFRGCMGRERIPGIVKATEQILDYLGVSYTILEDEKCCGSVLLRTGFCEDAKERMRANLKILSGSRLLVSCAGCYRMFKTDYPRIFNVNLDVTHTSQLFHQLLNDDEIQVRGDLKVTYHDPCHLARHCGEYEAPRRLLEAFGILIEMEDHGSKAQCCGAGGGVKSAYPHIAEKIAQKRIKQARDTGAEILCTTCPFCKYNLESHGMKVMDISEFIVDIMEGSKSTKTN
ncbi:MAG TPA: (Fe-S)-binding protein [Methanothermobacter sp.]|nr:CoB--CoM heterodisulfide reductase [Methanothermobacter sp. MT-2]HOK72621.1 (Fe-S)-binding protein [Methanothermobacter sp.]HOL68659.1 (Fe-S)-binding protein [Methanothermobacter sp.]HPQ04418.1 (Fe-S)-binding protein [Methanothermobacter sp.]HPU36609.1 (Fe-S)-binding protein [Methanothermobacter sp.]